MKYIMSLFIGCLFFLTGCKESIEGTWIRQGDDLQGMKIKVIKGDNTTYGIIVNNSDKEGSFKINETKWNNIKKVGKDNYECEDLRKSYYSEGKYIQSHMKIQGDLLTLDWFVNDGSSNGYHQLWMRERQ